MTNFARGERLLADDLNAAFGTTAAYAGGLNRLPIEWVETEYATELAGATLATDPRKVIQFAWDLSTTTGCRVTLGEPGTYAIDSSQASDAEWPNGPTASGTNRGCLVVSSNLNFEASPFCVFESGVSLGGARGMITTDLGNYRQAGYTPPSNITIKGGVWGKRGGAATTATGNIFGIEADDLRLIETMADGWQLGRAYNLAGNRHRHYRPGMRNPAGSLQSGGMRLWYGDDFDCDGLWGTCGDDAAQLVTGFDSTAYWFGSITRAWYRNARVTSNEARGAAVGLPAQNGVTPGAAGMSNSIAHCGYVDCLFTAGTGASPANIQNQYSSGTVRDIVFRRCVFDQTASTATNGIEIAGAWGGVEDVTFGECTVVSAYRDLIAIEGRVRHTTFRDCRLYAPRTEDSTWRPIRIQGASETRIEGGFAEKMAVSPGSPANALIDLGISSSTATYSGDTYTTTLDGCFIGDGFEARNIQDAQFAIRTTRCDRLYIDGMKLKKAATATIGVVKTMSVVGSNNGNIVLKDTDLTDAGQQENTAIDDTNAIVIRQGVNPGVKAPVQAIANASGDNGIVGRGVKRAELTTTSASYAITLNAPVLADKVAGGLVIEMVARGGSNDVTMSLTNVTNLGGAFTTATFNAVGDALVLVPLGTVWYLQTNNAVTLS